MHSSIIKKIIKILFTALLVVILLSAGIALFIQTVYFKHKVKTILIDKSKNILDAELSISKLDGSFFTSLSINDILLTSNTDTLCYIKNLHISYDLKQLLKSKIYINNIQFDSLYLRIEQNRDQSLNWQHIITNNNSDQTQQSSSKKWNIFVPDIQIEHGLAEIITHKDTTQTLVLSHFNMNAGFQYKDQNLEGQIQNLVFDLPQKETSLVHFEANYQKSDSLVAISDIKAFTDSSTINADIQYNIKNQTLKYLDIKESSLSMHELHQWLPQIQQTGITHVKINVTEKNNKHDITLQIEKNNQKIDITGVVSIFHTPIAFDLALDLKNIDISQWVNNSTQLPVSTINARLQTSGTWPSLSESDLKLNMALKNSQVNQYKINSFSLSGNKQQDLLTFNLNGRSPLGEIMAAGDATLGEILQYQLSAQLGHIQLQQTIPDLSSDIHFYMNTAGSWNGSLLKNNFTVKSDSLSFKGISVSQFILNGSHTNKQVIIDSISVLSPLGYIDLNGTFDENMDFQYKINPRDISPLTHHTTTLEGEITGTITGKPDSIALAGKINIKNALFDSTRIKSILGKILVEYADSVISADGMLNIDKIKSKRITIDSSLIRAKYNNNILYPNIAIKINDSTYIEITGSTELQNPLIIILDTLNIKQNGQYWQLEQNPDFAFDSSGIKVDNFKLGTETQSVSLNGSIGPKGTHNLDLEIKKLDLTSISNSLQSDKTFKGFLDSRFNFTGNLEAPVIYGQLTINNPTINNWDLSQITGQIEYSDSSLSLQSLIHDNLKQSMNIQGSLVSNLFTPTPKQNILDNDFWIKVNTRQMNVDFINAFLPNTMKISGDMIFNLEYQNKASLPLINGNIQLLNTGIDLPVYGANIANLNTSIKINDNKVVIEKLESKKENGRITGNGNLTIGPELHPQNINLNLAQFNYPFARGKKFRLTASGQLSIKGDYSRPAIKGNIKILESKIFLPLFQKTKKSNGTSPALLQAINGDSTKQSIKTPESAPLLDNITSIVSIQFDKNFWITNNDMNIELSGNLEWVQRGKVMTIFGNVETLRGILYLYSKRFEIDKGNINFTGNDKINPTVDITAIHTFRDIYSEKKKLYVNITGKAETPTISFILDDNTIEETDALSYLLFGHSSNELSYGEKKQMQENNGLLSSASLENWVAKRVTAPISRSLKEKLDLDIIEFQGSDNWRQNSIVLGKYLTNDLYLSYTQGFNLGQAHELVSEQVSLEYEMNRYFFIQATKGDEKSTGVDFIWKYEK